MIHFGNIELTHRVRVIEHASHEGVHAVSVPTHRGEVSGHVWGHRVGSGFFRSLLGRRSRFSIQGGFVDCGIFSRGLKGRFGAAELISSCLGLYI